MTTSTNTGLAEQVISGTLSRRIGSRALPFAPTGLDLEVLAAADAALTQRIPLALVLPPGMSAALLLGASAALSAALHRGKLNVRIGVGTARLSDRSLYDELAFGDQLLSAFVPRAALASDGRASIIGQPTPGAEGRLYLTGSLERLLPYLDELEGVVVDADSITSDQLKALLARARRVPMIYLTTDPRDRHLDVVREAGGVIWAFDGAALERLSHPGARPRTADSGPLLASCVALRQTAGSSVTIQIPAGEPRLDGALDQLWRAMAALATTLSSVPAGAGAAYAGRWAWAVTSTLLTLPVAPTVHDEYVQPGPYQLRLASVGGIARVFGRNAPMTARDPWAVFADALEDALRAAQEQPRTSMVLDWVRSTVGTLSDSGSTATLLVRNVVGAAALGAELDQSPLTPPDWRQQVSLRTVASLLRGGPAVQRPDHLCILGIPPRGRSALLTQPPAGAVRILTCGPAEARRAARMVVSTRIESAGLRQETLTKSAPRLNVVLVPESIAEPDRTVAVIAAGELTMIEGDASPDHCGFEVDMLALLNADDDEDLTPVRDAASAATDGRVPVIAVTLDVNEQPMVLLVEANDLLSRRRTRTISRVAAKSLRPGDRVLLVDRAARTDLRIALTSKLSERIAYSTLRMLIDFWHARAAAAGRNSRLTHQQILDRMHGTDITTAGTIGNWIRGVVDGPADRNDLARFARAVGDDQLLAKADGVGLALVTLHSVNRKLGHWLASQIADAPMRAGDLLVDAELGVHMADLLDAVSEHEVIGIDPTTSPARAYAIGHLLTQFQAAEATSTRPGS